MNDRSERVRANEFALSLRRWRNRRHLSQLALAERASVSTRHLSFLETGKAQPSRSMVQRLTQVLDVPLDERNQWLVAAGFAPMFSTRDLSAPELEQARGALEFILQQQEPFPALVVDGSWNVRMRNAAVARIFSLFLPRLGPRAAENAMHSVFCPQGLRPWIVNWEEVAGTLIQTIHREEATHLHGGTAQLRRELLAYPGVPEHWHVPDPQLIAPPLLTLQLRKDGLELAFFSTITMFAQARDITLQQLRIECLHPANAATADFARSLQAQAQTRRSGR